MSLCLWIEGQHRFMKSIDAIVEYYDRGQITRLETEAALARSITHENVAEVMTALPEEWAEDLRHWALTMPAQGIILGGNLTEAEEKKCAEKYLLARQALRAWLTTEGILVAAHPAMPS